MGHAIKLLNTLTKNISKTQLGIVPLYCRLAVSVC